MEKDDNQIVPGPPKKLAPNWPALLALSIFLASGVALVHGFLGLSESLQDKLLDHWPVIAPTVTAGVATLWSFMLGPVLHLKD